MCRWSALPLLAVMFWSADGLQDFANRVEGTNIRKNALNDLQLLAVHRGAAVYGSNANLHVRLFAPPEAGTLFVEAWELQDLHHYYMKSKSSVRWTFGQWNVFEPWPTRNVIDTLPVPPTNLGVLATYQSAASSTVQLPASVYADTAPPTASIYTLFVRTGRDLQSVDTIVHDAADRQTTIQDAHVSCNTTRNRNCVLYPAGSVQAFDVDMSPLAAGIVRVQLSGRVPRSTDRVALSIPIYHHL